MNRKYHTLLSLVAALLLAACGALPQVKIIPITNGGSTPEATALPTITRVFIPSATLAPTSTASPSPTVAQFPTATAAPIMVPSFTPVPTNTPAQAVTPCNLAGFIQDVTIPDGSVISAGDAFTKTWRLRNNGACTWTTGYALVFVSGERMGGPTVAALPMNVNPGETIDLSVSLIAPTSAGAYLGNWMLRDAGGVLFGTGSNGSQNFWVRIVVPSPGPFAVNRVDTAVKSTALDSTCLATLTFTANIYTNGAGTVTYYWQRSDGSRSATSTLTYSAAGGQTVEDTWSLMGTSTSTTVWDKVYIDQPNHQLFSPANFVLSCTLPTATFTPTPTQIPTVTPSGTSQP